VGTNDKNAAYPLGADAGQNAALVGHLTSLINDVYRVAEKGLWRDDATRTTEAEVAELIGAEEITVVAPNGTVTGSIRVHDVADDASEFGLLVVAPEQRGTGLGRALVDFAEERSRARELRAMQLELLVPRGWEHPNKEFLKGWYGRRGYRVIQTRGFDDAYPHLAPMLATECDLLVWEKPLRPAP
jgi:GNAT superfamily N-acetyltransferase